MTKLAHGQVYGNNVGTDATNGSVFYISDVGVIVLTSNTSYQVTNIDITEASG